MAPGESKQVFIGLLKLRKWIQASFLYVLVIHKRFKIKLLDWFLPFYSYFCKPTSILSRVLLPLLSFLLHDTCQVYCALYAWYVYVHAKHTSNVRKKGTYTYTWHKKKKIDGLGNDEPQWSEVNKTDHKMGNIYPSGKIQSFPYSWDEPKSFLYSLPQIGLIHLNIFRFSWSCYQKIHLETTWNIRSLSRKNYDNQPLLLQVTRFLKNSLEEM